MAKSKELGHSSTAERLFLKQEVEGSNPSVPAKARVEFADDTKIAELEEWVDKVLDAIGHPEAWVSDESMIWDFMPSVQDPDNKEWLKKLSDRLGMPVHARDTIHSLAARYKVKVEKQVEEWLATYTEGE